jgi:hypothetical protein
MSLSDLPDDPQAMQSDNDAVPRVMRRQRHQRASFGAGPNADPSCRSAQGTAQTVTNHGAHLRGVGHLVQCGG